MSNTADHAKRLAKALDAIGRPLDDLTANEEQVAEALRGVPLDAILPGAVAHALGARLRRRVPEPRFDTAVRQLMERMRDDEIAIYVNLLGNSLAAGGSTGPAPSGIFRQLAHVLSGLARAIEDADGSERASDEARKFLRDASNLSRRYVNSPFQKPEHFRNLLFKEVEVLLRDRCDTAFYVIALAITTYSFPSTRGVGAEMLARKLREGFRNTDFRSLAIDKVAISDQALSIAGVPRKVVDNLLYGAEKMQKIRQEAKVDNQALKATTRKGANQGARRPPR